MASLAAPKTVQVAKLPRRVQGSGDPPTLVAPSWRCCEETALKGDKRLIFTVHPSSSLLVASKWSQCHKKTTTQAVLGGSGGHLRTHFGIACTPKRCFWLPMSGKLTGGTNLHKGLSIDYFCLYLTQQHRRRFSCGTRTTGTRSKYMTMSKQLTLKMWVTRVTSNIRAKLPYPIHPSKNEDASKDANQNPLAHKKQANVQSDQLRPQHHRPMAKQDNQRPHVTTMTNPSDLCSERTKRMLSSRTGLGCRWESPKLSQ